MKRLTGLLLLFISFAVNAQETYSISGVVAGEKGDFIPGATVFLANTKNITATNNNGQFTFNQLQPGNYAVVVKMLGFEVYSQRVTIQKAAVNIPVRLNENSVTLKTVNITSMTAAMRKMYLQLFMEKFIGTSTNASQCKLLNPDAVQLDYNRPEFVLTANSDDFLVIENKGLGYRLHYLLANFRLEMGKNILYYSGSFYFEELKGSPSQQKKWAKNRREAYEGSIYHFFKAAFTNTLQQEGFVLYRFPDMRWLLKASRNRTKIKDKYFVPLATSDSLFTTVNEANRLFNLKALKNDSTELYIFYTRKNEPNNFIDENRGMKIPFAVHFPKKQTSVIYPLADSVLFDRNGNVNPVDGMLKKGYWSWQMAAEFLPPEYKVDEKH